MDAMDVPIFLSMFVTPLLDLMMAKIKEKGLGIGKIQNLPDIQSWCKVGYLKSNRILNSISDKDHKPSRTFSSFGKPDIRSGRISNIKITGYPILIRISGI